MIAFVTEVNEHIQAHICADVSQKTLILEKLEINPTANYVIPYSQILEVFLEKLTTQFPEYDVLVNHE